MKIRYSILFVLVLTAVVAALMGIRQSWVERESRRNIFATETSSDWVLKNLDIGNNSLSDYHTTVDKLTRNSGQTYRLVQFAHKIEMKDLIHEDIGIETCSGGFPYYFSVDVSEDGSEILSYYADRE